MAEVAEANDSVFKKKARLDNGISGKVHNYEHSRSTPGATGGAPGGAPGGQSNQGHKQTQFGPNDYNSHSVRKPKHVTVSNCAEGTGFECYFCQTATSGPVFHSSMHKCGSPYRRSKTTYENPSSDSKSGGRGNYHSGAPGGGAKLSSGTAGYAYNINQCAAEEVTEEANYRQRADVW